MNAQVYEEQVATSDRALRAAYWSEYQTLQGLWRRGDLLANRRWGRFPEDRRVAQRAIGEIERLSRAVEAALVELED